MRVPTLSTARFAVLVALVLALFSSGIVVGAAGAPLILGQSNSASGQPTSLTSGTAGSALKVNNPGSGRGLEVLSSNASPLKITAPAGKAPMTVNRSVKVANLNADKLDGLSSGSFLRSTRVRSASTSGLSSNAGARVLIDPRTGAEVLTATLGRMAIKNRNATLPLHVAGVCVIASDLQPWSVTIAPGATQTFSCQTVYDAYFDLSLMLQGTTVAQTRYSHLTCSFRDSGTPEAVVRSCIVVG